MTSAQTVTVSWAAVAGSAVAGADYVAASGTLTFQPGEMAKAVVVMVKGDALDEADETFFVNLSSPANAVIADGQGIGTIVDDDPTPVLSIGDVSLAEGEAGPTAATFSLSLSAPSGRVRAPPVP